MLGGRQARTRTAKHPTLESVRATALRDRGQDGVPIAPRIVTHGLRPRLQQLCCAGREQSRVSGSPRATSSANVGTCPWEHLTGPFSLSRHHVALRLVAIQLLEQLLALFPVNYIPPTHLPSGLPQFPVLHPLPENRLSLKIHRLAGDQIHEITYLKAREPVHHQLLC